MADTATTAVQDTVLDSVKTAQEATLKIARGWSKTLSSTPSTPEYFALPKPETYYGFVEKLWGAQKDFLVALLEVATDYSKTIPDTVKKATTATGAAPKA